MHDPGKPIAAQGTDETAEADQERLQKNRLQLHPGRNAANRPVLFQTGMTGKSVIWNQSVTAAFSKIETMRSIQSPCSGFINTERRQVTVSVVLRISGA